MQELRDVRRHVEAREVGAFSIADFVDQIQRITRAQVGDEVVADENAEPRHGRRLVTAAVTHEFHLSFLPVRGAPSYQTGARVKQTRGLR